MKQKKFQIYLAKCLSFRKNVPTFAFMGKKGVTGNPKGRPKKIEGPAEFVGVYVPVPIIDEHGGGTEGKDKIRKKIKKVLKIK